MLILFLYTALIGLLAIYANKSMPYVKPYLNAIITRIPRVFTRKSNTLLEQRVSILEKKMAKRHNNDRAAIREEIKNVLLQLKK